MPDRRQTIADIIAECDKQGLPLPEQKAYVLATVEHETNDTFEPVRESYWKSEEWRKAHLRYWPFYGRGYVQITWRTNYLKYSQLLDIDLVSNPDLALEHPIALFILVHGFKHGTFTGRRLERYIRPGTTEFFKARRCINGLDKAGRIRSLANRWMQEFSSMKITTYQLQQALNEHGADPILVCDGIEGPKTKAAIGAFQKSNGLAQDGVAGHETLTRLGLIQT
jgi:predicted chitinase